MSEESSEETNRTQELYKNVNTEKRVEEKDIESESRYRKLFDSLLDGIAFTDLDGLYQECNQAYLDLLGYTMDELHQKNFRDVTPPEYHYLEKSLLQEQIFTRGYSDEFDKEYIKKTGERITVNIRVWLRVNHENQPIGMWVLVRDITAQKKMREALRKSKDFTDSLITSMQDGFIVLDKYGFHIEVNPAFCRITGFSKEEIIGGGPPYPYWPIWDFDRIERFLSMTLHEKSCDYEAIFIRKNGERFPVIISPSCVKDQQGNTISYLATFKEISERKQAEIILRESEQRFRGIIENSQDGIILFDREWMVREWNRGLENITGLKREEVIDQSFWEMQFRLTPVELRTDKKYNMFKEYIQKLSQTNQLPKSGKLLEMIIQRPDGTRRVIQPIIFFIVGSKGNLIGSIIRDVTDQKQYEERLKILHKIDHAILETKPLDELIPMVTSNLRQLVNCQRVSIVSYDMENHEVSVLNVNVNGETIWGTGRRFSQEIYEIPKEFEQGEFSLIGDLQAYKEQTPIHKDLLFEGIHTYLSVPLIVQSELMGAIHLGAHQPDAFNPEQIEIAREFASQMAIAIRQQRLDEQVRAGRAQLQKLTQRVLSAQEEERRCLSRELHDEAGQDLTALKISLELIKKEIPLEFKAIHDSLGEAITLTDTTMEQIRSLAKGLRPPALDAVGLKYALEALCRDSARRSNIKIEYMGANLPLLSEEINICFYRILQESLTNACKHARAAHIFVTLRQEVGNICLEVKDDGQGFRKENRNRNSMGIGLLGIKERLKMLGGRLEVKSQPGRGTILIAYIPWLENV